MVNDDIADLVGQSVTVRVAGRQVSGTLTVEGKEIVIRKDDKQLRFAMGYIYKVDGNTIHSL